MNKSPAQIAAEEYVRNIECICHDPDLGQCFYHQKTENQLAELFLAGAQWQKEQDEKGIAELEEKLEIYRKEGTL